MAKRFRLFNCDRTFNLDKVKALITSVSPGAEVVQHYFPLPKMKNLCDELNDELSKQLFDGYAVFVVHAHESRLSLNEENAGIGYAKIYRTLLKLTEGRVFIVIGGDNNYKNEEQERNFLSKWAWRKICSQFTEDFMDGTESFIFSWEESHRPIHEEALKHYLEQKHQKFVPKPKPQAPKPPATQTPKSPTTQTTKPSTTQATKPTTTQTTKSPTTQTPKPLPTQTTKPSTTQATKSTTTQATTSTTTQTTKPTATQATKQTTLTDTTTPAKKPSTQPSYSGNQLPSSSNKQRDLPRPDDYTKGEPSKASQATIHTDDTKDDPSKATQATIHTMVQVVSMSSNREEVLQYPVLSLIGNAFKSLGIISGPYVPDVQFQALQDHIKATDPDFVVLLTEYDHFMDIENLDYKRKHFMDVLKCVRDQTRARLILVVTGDTNHKEGDLSSSIVEGRMKEMNKDILKHDKLTILSWKDSPSSTHENVIKRSLHHHQGSRNHPRKVMKDTNLERNRDKGLLRYRAIIQGGCVQAIITSLPYDWKPHEWLISQDLLKKHHTRTMLEIWEKGDGTLYPTAKPSPMPIYKLVDVDATDQIHSVQLYSNHPDKNTMQTFFKGVGIPFLPRPETVGLNELPHDIAKRRPQYVALSTDFKELPDLQSISDHVTRYSSYLKNVKGIVIILIGDENCEDGKLVSGLVLDKVTELSQNYLQKSLLDKVTVMSWKNRPFICHQDRMKSVLFKNVEFDSEKGYLRFRAKLKNGRIGEIPYRFPSGWYPDQQDVDFLKERYKDKANAVLEFWADSLVGPTKPPFVTEYKGFFSW